MRSVLRPGGGVRQSPAPGQHQAGRLTTFCTQCTLQYRKQPITVVVGGRMGGREKSCSWTASGRQTHHILYTMYCTILETTNDFRSQGRMGGRETPVLTGAWTKSRVLRVFLLALHSHLYSFALQFIFL